jgi:hypothetical protein
METLERLSCVSCGSTEFEKKDEFLACKHCGTNYKEKVRDIENVELPEEKKEIIKTDMSKLKVNNCIIKGDMNKIEGNYNIIKGDMNTIKGIGNRAKGDMNKMKWSNVLTKKPRHWISFNVFFLFKKKLQWMKFFHGAGDGTRTRNSLLGRQAL